MSRSNGPTILVVDDNVDIREVTSMILSHHGFRVAVACNGEEAVQHVRQHGPDVVLMDLMMPVMTGYDAVRELAGNGGSELAIVAVTACDVSRRDLEPLGFCGLLRKPVGAEEILAAVRHCLEGPREPRWIPHLNVPR